MRYHMVYSSIHSTQHNIASAFPLVGASNVGGLLCRCDPLTQTWFVFRCYYKHQT